MEYLVRDNTVYSSMYKQHREERKMARVDEAINLLTEKFMGYFQLEAGRIMLLVCRGWQISSPIDCFFAIFENGKIVQEMNSAYQRSYINFYRWFEEAPSELFPGVWTFKTKKGRGYSGGHNSQAEFFTYNAPENKGAINLDLTTQGDFSGYYPEMGYLIPLEK